MNTDLYPTVSFKTKSGSQGSFELVNPLNKENAAQQVPGAKKMINNLYNMSKRKDQTITENTAFIKEQQSKIRELKEQVKILDEKNKKLKARNDELEKFKKSLDSFVTIKDLDDPNAGPLYQVGKSLGINDG